MIGLVAHALQCVLLASIDAASVRWSSPRLLVVPLITAAGAAALAHVAPSSPALLVAGAWLAAGLAHHYLVGITASWDGRPVRGLAHVGWDLAFHLPALLTAAVGTRRSVGSPGPGVT
ncbi:MAG: hypothetical protein M3Z03_06045 [Actinomycetota bacterium]|nr:hypothetical protein [Actinomycetota bacterium]